MNHTYSIAAISCYTIILFFVLGCANESSQNTPPQSIMDYQLCKHTLGIPQQFDLAMNVLNAPVADELIIYAIEDLMNIIGIEDRRSPYQSIASVKIDTQLCYDASQALEKFMEQTVPTSLAYQQAYYSNARLYLLMGRRKAAIDKFLYALRNRYQHNDGPGIFYFADSVKQQYGWRESAIVLYNTAIHDQYLNPTERNFISHLLNDLVWMNKNPPYTNALTSVYPELESHPNHPKYKRIAKALCLIVDKEYEKADQMLQSIDRELELKFKNKPLLYQEYRNIPVYQAAIIYHNQGNEQKLRKHLNEFWIRNQDRPSYVINFGSIFYHWRTNLSMSVMVTTFLEDLGFFTNPSLTNQIDKELLTHIYDLHLQGVYYANNNWRRAKQIALELTGNYFPKTPGSVNAMWLLARIQETKEMNMQAAEKTYIKIMLESPYDIWVDWSEIALINLWLKEDQTSQSLLVKLRSLLYSPNQLQQQRLDSLNKKIKNMYIHQQYE